MGRGESEAVAEDGSDSAKGLGGGNECAVAENNWLEKMLKLDWFLSTEKQKRKKDRRKE